MNKKKETTIKKLSEGVIAQIAAGQVVDRPASVVKELVENALDASAKHIFISLQNGGIDKIIVADDGFGMSKKNLHQSYLHHTTSKVSSESDLLRIQSFGFRGEALSSIAAVARLRIETKEEKSIGGSAIEVKKGKIIDSSPVGMPAGTRVIVSGLFSSIPARKKFLKSATTELRHCTTVVSTIALAYPTVSFILTHNETVVLELPIETVDSEYDFRAARIQSIFGSEFFNHLLEFKASSDHISVSGYIGKPQLATSSKKRQFLYVNNRPVEYELLSKRIKEVFSTLVEPKSYPAYILFVSASPDLFDINVDPQKTQVKFISEEKLLLLVESELAKVLSRANIGFSQRLSNGMYEEFTMDPGIAEVIKSQGSGWNVKDAELIAGAEILQVHNLYLVAQTKRGILLVDQHAAHERILFYEYLQRFKKERFKQVKLKKPITLSLPQQELNLLKDEKQTFVELGFNFSQDFRLVTKIPKVFKTRNIGKLIQELLHDMLHFGKTKSLDVGTHRTLSYLACRTAIKSGDVLTQQERKRLLEKLAKTPEKYTCPHGRPVEVELDIGYLEKLFKRS